MSRLEELRIAIFVLACSLPTILHAGGGPPAWCVVGPGAPCCGYYDNRNPYPCYSNNICTLATGYSYDSACSITMCAYAVTDGMSCLDTDCSVCGGGGSPEMSGTGKWILLSLLMSICVVAYRRLRIKSSPS